MTAGLIPPDLQAAVFCEDVRTEISGQQTLIGVFGMIPAQVLPIGFLKLCLWTRWCGGTGSFMEKSLILGCDDEQVIAQSDLRFSLPGLDSYVTNVHVLGGVQFQQYGIYHVEIHLDDELEMRFPLPVVRVSQPGSPST
ncbi:MAG TPA: hypothetical protein VIS96_01765 [Terrimicrobiaceae bacterium]